MIQHVTYLSPFKLLSEFYLQLGLTREASQYELFKYLLIFSRIYGLEDKFLVLKIHESPCGSYHKSPFQIHAHKYNFELSCPQSYKL